MLHALRQTSILLFVALQFVCAAIIYKTQSHHKNVVDYIFLSASSQFHALADGIEKRFSTDTKELDALREANTKLRRELAYSKYLDCGLENNKLVLQKESLFTYTAASVISNSYVDQENYIIINRGKHHGIQAGNGVISDNGVVGVVLQSTSQYSQVMSLKHVNMKLSAALSRTNHHGTITWQGGKSNHLFKFDFIPSHVPVNIQDTIVTSGYSLVFPKGINVGVVSQLQKKTNNSHDIDVQLLTDLNSLSTVYVISNQHQAQLDSLR